MARLDIGSAFELFYLGVLHPSNKIDPNASPSAPFISCLPMGTGRIERGNPQLIAYLSMLMRAVEDFLAGKITERLSSTRAVRHELRKAIGYGDDLDILASRGKLNQVGLLVPTKLNFTKL